jgi:hypothetical protein
MVLFLTPVISLAGTTGENSSPYAALGEPVAPQGDDTMPLNSGAIHFDLGTDFETADFFRGIRQPVNSPAFQGYIDLYFDIVKAGPAEIGAYVGVRDGGAEKSHNGAPLTDYLQEIFAGVTAECHEWSLDLGYVEHHAPDGTFATVDEIGARLEYDDSDLMEKWGIPLQLQPHIEIFREVLDQSAFISSRSEPAKQNTYLELGIAPQHRFQLGQGGNCSINVALPVTAGMSWDNYYSLTPTSTSNFLGFVSVGAIASYPLPLPAKFGAWDVRGGVTYVNDTANGARQIDHNHADFFTMGLGLAMQY